MPLSCSNLVPVVCLSPNSIIWNGWEDKSGVALDMRHRLQRFIHQRAHSLLRGDEHPTYTPRTGTSACRILVMGVNAPLPPEAKKILKI